MKKTITICLFISLFILTRSASALSFGEIKVYSKFAEPFKAEIPIPSYKSEELRDIQIRLASKEEFDKRGIERPEILKKFKFNVIQKRDKSRTIYVICKSPIKELSFGLLLEAAWSKGSLIKVYNILLTPDLASEHKQQSVIAQALKENSDVTITEALLSLIAKKVDGTSIQLLTFDEINKNFREEWHKLTNYSSEANKLPLLQASARTAQVTQEEIESKKLELESIREFAAELDFQNGNLREQVLALEEDLLLSTKSIFNDSIEKELPNKNTIATTAQGELDADATPISLESLASMQKQKEILIAALILLIVLLVAYKKKGVIMQKLQVRKNRKADAEAEF